MLLGVAALGAGVAYKMGKSKKDYEMRAVDESKQPEYSKLVIWMNNSDNGEGIPLSNRFERQIPSHITTPLGRAQEERDRARASSKVKHLYAETQKVLPPAEAFTPRVQDIPQATYEHHLMNAIKSGKLQCKSSTDIAKETWTARHRDQPQQRILTQCYKF